MTHEDERRKLISSPYRGGEIKTIQAKKDCVLGNHYHKIKTEDFRLIHGVGTITIEDITHPLIVGLHYIVDINQRHSFSLKKDAVLNCICSHPYDKTDDYGY